MSTRFDSEPISGTFGTTGVRMRVKSTRILTLPFATRPKVPWSGEQTLVPGVRPVTTRDRYERSMTQPKAGTRQQKPCDLGMFDVNARAQLDQSISSSAPMSTGVRRHLRRRTIPKLDGMLNDLIQATRQKDT